MNGPWFNLGKPFITILFYKCSNSDLIFSELAISERQTEYFSHENRPCKRYNDGNDRNSILKDSKDFMECSRREMWKLMKPKINCSIVGLELFFDHPNEMSQCQTESDAKITLEIYHVLFYEDYKKFWIKTCLLPCIQVNNIYKHDPSGHYDFWKADGFSYNFHIPFQFFFKLVFCKSFWSYETIKYENTVYAKIVYATFV